MHKFFFGMSAFFKRWAGVISLLCLVYLGFRWIQFFDKADPQDFNIYYYGALAEGAGESPYSQSALHDVSGGKTKFYFVYPPYTLKVFAGLTAMDQATAARFYLILKTLLLAALIVLWIRMSRTPDSRATLAQILLLVSIGYYESVFRDFRHGNISTVEQFFLWSGIFWFCRGKYMLFAAAVVFASFFKLILIPFLALLAFVPGRKGWGPLAAGAVSFSGLQIFSYLLQSERYQAFLTMASGLGKRVDERGAHNPATWNLLKDVLPENAALIVFILLVLVLAVLFFGKIIRERRLEFDPLWLAVGFCLVYALAMPRMKNYSYIQMIFPTIYILYRHFPVNHSVVWLAVIFAGVHVFSYQSLAMMFVFFFLWLRSQPVGSARLEAGT